ncbi:aldehyde dehydrogenase [Sanyastnella coralliicola]|uniref:aldehyde dehydrogenase n=1 Tax=Sanyastnella coralliicola TaxID=3069118 RepID=UPI0027B93421|nr:aldehyde dehydrogenase [Longitalea sp. SCSIO 12813]
MEKILNFINGEFAEPANGQWIDNYEPATGKVYSQIPNSDADDVERAYEAANAAFPIWSNTPYQERSRILSKLADLIGENLDALAAAESKDNGKPVSLASHVDIPRAESNIRFFSTAIMHYASEAHIMEDRVINYTNRKPVGVVGCISPWNLPLYLFTWKIAPALASGCTVVAKPSEITPMTAYLMSKLCNEAGLPAGVLNIVHGHGHQAGDAMVSHPGIKAISFTGGTTTGALIAKKAAPMFKKLSLELGGKNPNIIFADCDFDQMIRTTVRSSFANQGQICLCGSRIFVEASIYDKFKEAFVAKVKRMQIGDPSDQSTKFGAVVSKPHMEKVLSYIELAKEEGGTVLCGGKQHIPEDGNRAEGYYIEPTVIEGLDYQCRVQQEEIFGPVVTITPFESDEHALEMANSVEYGLAATVWTSNLTRAHRVAQQIHSGIVWINCWLVRDLRTPFGGVKNSGVGREGGFEALHFFTEPQNVCIQLKS